MSLERKKQSRLKGPGECAKWRRQSANCTKASSKCHRGLLYPHIAQVFPPKQRALFYTWIHFIQQLAVFFKHIFTARSTTGLLCALPLTDSGCSHASRQSAPILFYVVTGNVLIWKLSPFLGIFDPVSDVDELKAAKIEESKARTTSEAFGEFWEHHGEKGASERDGGIKSNYFNVEFLTLFMCLSFEIWTDLCVVGF